MAFRALSLLIRLHYEGRTLAIKRTPRTETPVSGAVSVLPDSEATSGQGLRSRRGDNLCSMEFQNLDEAVRLWRLRAARIDALIADGTPLSEVAIEGESVSDYQFWLNGRSVQAARKAAVADPLRALKIQTFLMLPLVELKFLFMETDPFDSDSHIIMFAIDRKEAAMEDLALVDTFEILRR